MPEGDTIFRAARTLQRALGGQMVTRFETVLPKLARVDDDTPLAGRTVERWKPRQVDADAFLRRPDSADPHADERELAHLPPGRTMAAARVAHAHRDRDRGDAGGGVQCAGGRVSHRRQPGAPRRLQPPRPCPALARIRRGPCRSRTWPRAPISSSDWRCSIRLRWPDLATCLKSEVAFACGLNPFRKVATLHAEQLAGLVATSRKFLLANVTETSGHATHDRPHRSRRIPVGLRPRGPAVPPVRHSHRIRASTPPMAGSASGVRSASR